MHYDQAKTPNIQKLNYSLIFLSLLNFINELLKNHINISLPTMKYSRIVKGKKYKKERKSKQKEK